MLIAFKVNNFMSFADEQKLSMIPSLEGPGFISLNNIKLLRAGVIFGANSSGKSNFIKAMAFGKDMALSGISGRFRNKFSRVALENQNKESTFEYTLYSNGHYYSYGFSLVFYKGLFTGEYLYELTEDDQEILLYERKGEEISYHLELNEHARTILSNLKEKILKSGLILHFVDELTDPAFEAFRNIASWFRNKLNIYFQDQEYLLLESDPLRHRERYLHFLKMFDTGITDFEEQKLDLSILETLPLRVQERIRSRLDCPGNMSFALRLSDALYSINRNEGEVEIYAISFRHHNDFAYDFEEESDGTKRLFDLLDIIISPVPNAIYLIDEINRSIHPLLTAEYLRLFKGSLRENNVQILFTTHEVSLLREDLIRRDEIWFMEKQADASSRLFSLDIFKKENQNNLSSSYLSGKYGGVPLFTDEEK
ncbi:MAG: ATP-binding protein [Acholeplasmataceae bacterium]|nr:ATP-binding protein [Acholeplasmataceae bacterium]